MYNVIQANDMPYHCFWNGSHAYSSMVWWQYAKPKSWLILMEYGWRQNKDYVGLVDPPNECMTPVNVPKSSVLYWPVNKPVNPEAL